MDNLLKKIAFSIGRNSSTWEDYHESSKTSPYSSGANNDYVVQEMGNMHEELPFKNKESYRLPDTLFLVNKDVIDVVLARQTARVVHPVQLSILELKTLLHCGYGITRDNKHKQYVRSFRVVPSGGALYPLELYFYINDKVTDLKPGLYHYAPSTNSVHLVRLGNLVEELSKCFVSFQDDLVCNSSLIIFITAVFRRSVFKYKEKGYRFVLLEAGHVAQNLNLVATAMGLGVINIGGFYERALDNFLNIDGLNHASIYMSVICKGE